MKAADLNRWVTVAQEELRVARDSIRDRGAKYFIRPLGLGLFAAFMSYFTVYKMPQERLGTIEADLEAAKATAKYATTYQDLHDKLAHIYQRLPRSKDPGEWLLASIRESLRQEGIVPTSISPPTDMVVEGYRFISITVRCETGYQQIASWISRLERGEALMYVRSMTLTKKAKPIGQNSADITVSTVVPEKLEVP